MPEIGAVSSLLCDFGLDDQEIGRLIAQRPSRARDARRSLIERTQHNKRLERFLNIAEALFAQEIEDTTLAGDDPEERPEPPTMKAAVLRAAGEVLEQSPLSPTLGNGARALVCYSLFLSGCETPEIAATLRIPEPRVRVLIDDLKRAPATQPVPTIRMGERIVRRARELRGEHVATKGAA